MTSSCSGPPSGCRPRAHRARHSPPLASMRWPRPSSSKRRASARRSTETRVGRGSADHRRIGGRGSDREKRGPAAGHGAGDPTRSSPPTPRRFRLPPSARRSGRRERTIGAHYWNPPLLMPLVEVIRGDETRPKPRTEMTAILRALGKRPVLVDRDVLGSPGIGSSSRSCAKRSGWSRTAWPRRRRSTRSCATAWRAAGASPGRFRLRPSAARPRSSG